MKFSGYNSEGIELRFITIRRWRSSWPDNKLRFERGKYISQIPSQDYRMRLVLPFWMGTASRKGVFLALSDAWKRRRLCAASAGRGAKAVKSESVEKRRGIGEGEEERDESKFK